MSSRFVSTMALVMMVLGLTSSALAADPSAADTHTAAAGPTVSDVGIGRFAGPIGAGLVLFGGGAAISRIGTSACESIARQPEAGGRIFTAMIITAAMVEGAALFGVVVCLLAVN